METYLKICPFHMLCTCKRKKNTGHLRLSAHVCPNTTLADILFYLHYSQRSGFIGPCFYTGKCDPAFLHSFSWKVIFELLFKFS